LTSYLLDNDIAIELLRGRCVHVASRLASKTREQIFLSTVTVAELLFGSLRSRDPEKGKAACRQFCSSFQLAELDYQAAERSSFIRADLEARGERIGTYDVLIAGTALARDCVLATVNVREFGRVAGLRIEDWTVPA
jgi:tRNA(fMet)-specific endonuclease VapC